MSRLLDDFMRVANNIESELETKATKDDVQVLKATICNLMNVLDTLVEQTVAIKGRIDKLEWRMEGDDGK